jgi:hypothetical protein
VSVQEADLSAEAPWLARPQAAAWSGDRYAAERQRVACRVRNALVGQRVACQRVASLSEQQSAEPAVSDAQAQPPGAAEEVAAYALAQQPAVATVLLAQPVEVAAEHAAAVAEEAVPHAAVAAEEAAVEHAEAAEAAVQALPRAVAVEERVLPRVAAAQLVLRAAVARPSAAPSAFHPGRVLPWPAPPRAARFAHAMPCSQIAPLTARWWQAARGEVWSW